MNNSENDDEQCLTSACKEYHHPVVREADSLWWCHWHNTTAPNSIFRSHFSRLISENQFRLIEQFQTIFEIDHRTRELHISTIGGCRFFFGHKSKGGQKCMVFSRHFNIAITDWCIKWFPYSFLQNFYRTKIKDDLWCRVDSACKLVMIHDDLLMVRGFAADSVDITFMLHELLRH